MQSLFQNISVRAKILLIVGVNFFLMVSLGGIAYFGLNTLDQANHNLIQRLGMLRNQLEADMMHDALRADVLNALLFSMKDKTGVADAEKERQEHTEWAQKLLKENQQQITDTQVQALLLDAMKLWDRYLNSAQSIIAKAQEDGEAAYQQRTQFMEDFGTLEADMEKLSDAIEADAQKAQEMQQASMEQQHHLIIGLSSFALLVGLVLGLSFSRMISRSLNILQNRVEKISLGDLNVEIELTSRDEIGHLAEAMRRMVVALKEKVTLAEAIAQGDLTQSVHLASEQDILGRTLQTMIHSLNETLAEVSTTANQVAHDAQTLSNASQTLARGAATEASALEQISASIAEVAQQTQLNADNSSQANQLALSSRQSASEGDDRMQAMVTAMSDINHASSNISKIIKVIDEIAFQTNLLALNAAVEAARAGKYGKGFAVVAEEVRNLAERSAQAAKETTAMIEDSIKRVRGGIDIANQTAEALNHIVNGVSKVSDLVGEIAAASKEQATGLSQVNQGLVQVEHVTQNNTAIAEESAASAEEMERQAARLREILTRFRLQGRSANSPQMTPEMKQKIQNYLAQQKAPISGQVSPPSGANPRASLPKAPASVGGLPVFPKPAMGAAPSGQKVDPSQVIALDDHEFGRY